jgi:tRNA G18 (ribose-2'-O)-methylase SpoU
VDPLYRRAVRVSMGQILRVPWARAEPWPACLGELKTTGFRIVALTPDPAAPALIATPGRTAILVGAEGPGLSAEARARVGADELRRIPMAPGVDSLNVATAAAIAFHQFARMRPEPSTSSRVSRNP